MKYLKTYTQLNESIGVLGGLLGAPNSIKTGAKVARWVIKKVVRNPQKRQKLLEETQDIIEVAQKVKDEYYANIKFLFSPLLPKASYQSLSVDALDRLALYVMIILVTLARINVADKLSWNLFKKHLHQLIKQILDSDWIQDFITNLF